jgi:hypothetical protein
MKNIAIVTLIGYTNYGNKLQNYALQEVLTQIGFNVETIVYEQINTITSKRALFKKVKRLKNKDILDIIQSLNYRYYIYANAKQIAETKERRTKIFKNFADAYINEIEHPIDINNFPADLVEKYDYFVVGSDQVWNPAYNFGHPFFFLNFASKDRRVAYAASFGVSNIDPNYERQYKNWINGIDKISVREEAGAKFVKSLTGRNVPVLVDPTLLLTKKQWLEIAKPSIHKPKSKYLLTYFLGRIPRAYKKQIVTIAEKNNLEILHLNNIREKEFYEIGPSEFLDYINSCAVFCTDSFHGAVFSILLQKPFVVYERIGSMSMFSRLQTLLDKFDFTCRNSSEITPDEIFNIDFSHVSSVLEKERREALDFLTHALGMK